MEIHFTISNFSNLATTVFTFPLIIIILKIISVKMMDHMKNKIMGIISLQTNLGFPNWDFHNPTICNPPL